MRFMHCIFERNRKESGGIKMSKNNKIVSADHIDKDTLVNIEFEQESQVTCHLRQWKR